MILGEDVGGRERVTTDEERVAHEGLNRDQAVQSSGKSFIGKRKKFKFNMFIRVHKYAKILLVNTEVG